MRNDRLVVLSGLGHAELHLQSLKDRRAAGNDQQAEVVSMPTETYLGNLGSFGALHGGRKVGGQDSPPHPTPQHYQSTQSIVRGDRRTGQNRGDRRRLVQDGKEEFHGDGLAQRTIDFLQVEAEAEVPDMVEFGVVVLAEPPEPVASFGDQYMAPGRFQTVRAVRQCAGPTGGAAARSRA